MAPLAPLAPTCCPAVVTSAPSHPTRPPNPSFPHLAGPSSRIGGGSRLVSWIWGLSSVGTLCWLDTSRKGTLLCGALHCSRGSMRPSGALANVYHGASIASVRNPELIPDHLFRDRMQDRTTTAHKFSGPFPGQGTGWGASPVIADDKSGRYLGPEVGRGFGPFGAAALAPPPDRLGRLGRDMDTRCKFPSEPTPTPP